MGARGRGFESRYPDEQLNKMATVNSYLRSLVKEYIKSKSTKSVYYILNKNHIIRVSDHVSTANPSQFFVQIITPFNKTRMYIVLYKNNIMQFNFAELKTFLQTILLIAHVSAEASKIEKANREKKEINFISEISGTPEEMLKQVKVVYESLGRNAKKKFRDLFGIESIDSLDKTTLMQFLKSKIVRNFFKNRKIEVKVWN